MGSGGRYWLFVLIMWIACFGSSVVATGEETSALLEFMKGVGGGCLTLTWSPASAADECPASFCGVTCGADGNVIAVQLAGQGLRGSVRPNSLARLRALSILDLSNNQLSGNLPVDLGALANLHTLDFSHNSFTGPIPSTIGRLISLVNLSLAANQLSVSIPSSLGALCHLLSLNLSSNSLQEGIPPELSQMESLKVLDLHSNQLSGGIDPALLGLSSLERVDLSSNKLSGFLPWQPNDTLPLLHTLKYVNLSNNQLTGPLAPTRFTSVFAEKLQVLDMSHNQLSGNLPDFEFEIGLVTIRLSHNLFTGAVPSTLLSTNLGLLEELDLSNNNLTGEITRVLSTSLVVLNVSYNSLSGMIPQKIGSCAIVDLSNNGFFGDLSYLHYWSDMLEVLDLSFNHLSGGLIDEVSRFVRLRSLNMSHNALFGSIPSDYGTFPKLMYMDLSFNHLNGTIPASFFNSLSLSSLLLSNNDLGGNIPLPAMLPFKSVLDYPSGTLNSPIQAGQVSQLTRMDLSSNRLSGCISEGIGNFKKLRVVNLSNNQISGSIPEALRNLMNLQGLDLSENLLTGSIPDALPSTLRVLLLSNNSLSGLIPVNLQRFPASSFFPGNSGLVPGWACSSSKGSFAGSHSDGGIHRAVKAGLIGGCTAGLVLILAVALFTYSRGLTKFQAYRKSSGLGANNKTDDRKGVKICTPCAALFSFSESHSRSAGSGPSSLDGLLARHPPTTQVLSMKGKSSWEQALKPEPGHDSKMSGIDISPARTRQVFSAEPVLYQESLGVTEEVIDIDTPIVLKVQSPDRLAGDLYFLDKSLKFTAEELSRAPAEVLGRSSHGTTYKATLDNGYLLTVKWLREGLAKNKKEFFHEAKKFAKVRHPNLNPTRGYYWGPQEHEKLILSDFAVFGSLAAHLADRTGQRYAPLPWQQRLSIAVDVVRGLLYLHDDRHIPHGNLKATNVLIGGSNLSARLTDYCLHLLMTPQGTASQILNAGALGYRAPELATMKRPKPTMKGDIYALGVLMLELLTGKGAGDIISGQSGAVDLTDWVRLLALEQRSFECLDPLLLGSSHAGTEPPLGLEDMLRLALLCISPHTSQRPTIAMVYEEITSFIVTKP